MKKMLVDPVKVGALVGHGERSIKKGGDRDYSIFATRQRMRNSMVNQGFDVVEVNFQESKDVPENINILLIPEMRQAMTDEELLAIDRFVERGGNLVILADVGRQEAMNPLMARFGMRMLEGQIAQPSQINPYHIVLSRATQVAADTLKGPYRTIRGRLDYNAITMPGAVALEMVDSTLFRPMTLLMTDTLQTWIEKQTTDFIEETPTCDTVSGNECIGSYVTAVALTRMHKGKQQRILVLGDADCWSNAELLASRAGINAHNFTMIPNAFRWLCYGEFPVSSPRPKHRDMETSLTPMMMPTIKNIYCIGIPLFIGLIGVIVIMRRKRG
jgi:ABC-2 type transport system permease protein